MIASSLSSIFSCLYLPNTLLLLLSIPSDHFFFKLLHLLLSPLKCALFVNAKYHVGLGLIHFHRVDSCHFTILVYHLLNNVIDLLFLLLVLLVSLVFKSSSVGYLLMEEFFHAHTILYFPAFFFSSNLVLNFLRSEHNFVNVRVLFLEK